MAALDTSASWWLKVQRAEKHLTDIGDYIARATGPNPRRIRIEKRHDGTRWNYFACHDLVIDPIVAVVIGEFLYDLRSALDHIVAANVNTPGRRRKSQFPIFTEDIFATLPNGQLIEEHASRRDAWKGWLKGVPDAVVAVIKDAQPYAKGVEYNSDPNDHALAILDTYQLADKHRELAVIDGGIDDPHGMVIYPDGTPVEIDYRNAPAGVMARDGTRVFDSDTEVDVQLTGTLKVAMTRRPEPGDEVPAPTVPGVRPGSLPDREIPAALDSIFEGVGNTLALIQDAM